MAQQFFNRNIAEECHQQMRAFAQAGNDVTRVAFPPGGGQRFSILTRNGAYFNRNIPDECHQAMGQLSQNGARIMCVAFDKDGNGWSVVNDRGAYLNRNIPDEAHMIMGYRSQIHGPVRSVALDGDANGWSVISALTKDEKVCDASGCVDISEVYANIQARLNGKVVGYACTVGAASIGAYSAGFARTATDAPGLSSRPQAPARSSGAAIRAA